MKHTTANPEGKTPKRRIDHTPASEPHQTSPLDKHPTALSPASILRLQRTRGNRFVLRYLADHIQRDDEVDQAPGLIVPTGIPPVLQPFVNTMLAAIQAGQLQVTPQQAQSLMRLLQNLVAEPDLHLPGEEVPSGGLPSEPSIALSHILGQIVGQDLGGMFGGNELLVPQSWLEAHPVVITSEGSSMGSGTSTDLVPYGGRSSGRTDGQMPDIYELLRTDPLFQNFNFTIDLSMFQQPNIPRPMLALPAPPPTEPTPMNQEMNMLPTGARRFLLAHQDNLELAFVVLLAAYFDPSLAADVFPYVLAAGEIHPTIIIGLVQFLNQYRTHLDVAYWVLEQVGFDLTIAGPLMPTLIQQQIQAQDEVQYATTIFYHSESTENVNQWVKKGKRMGAKRPPALPPITSPAQNAPIGSTGISEPQHKLGNIVGELNYRTIRDACYANNRPYAPNPFIGEMAELLVGANVSVANTTTLLTLFCNHIVNEADFSLAIKYAVALFSRPGGAITFPNVQTFFTNHIVFATTPGNLNVFKVLIRCASFGGVAQDWTDLVAVVGILAPLGAQNRLTLLNTQFEVVNTPSLTIARLRSRLQNFTQPVNAGGQNIAIGNVAGEFQPLENSLNQRVNINQTMTGEAATYIRRAFRLLNCTRAQMMAFLNAGALNGEWNKTTNQNPAFWLYQFARYWRGQYGGGFVGRNVNVNGGGGVRNVAISNNTIAHIRDRHTFENFRFDLNNVVNNPNRPFSTMFNVGLSDDDIANDVQNMLGKPEVSNDYPWNPNRDIAIGSIQLRIGPVGGPYEVVSYFYWAGAGIKVSRAALVAMQPMFT